MTFSDLLNVGYFGFNFGMEDNWNSNILGLAVVACAIVAYLLGSINCGVIISKDKYGNKNSKWIKDTQMNFLEEKIMKDGVIREGNVLKVDKFLNHQMGILFFSSFVQ